MKNNNVYAGSRHQIIYVNIGKKKKGKDMLLYLHLDTRAIRMKCNSSISLRAQDIVAGANNDLSYFGVKINYKYICIYYS